MDDEWLLDDSFNRHARVEGCIRILEDDLHPAPQAPQVGAGECSQLDTVEEDLAAGRTGEIKDAARERGLAATGLTDESEGFACPDVEREIIDRPEHSCGSLTAEREVFLQMVDPKQGLVGLASQAGRQRLLRHVDAHARAASLATFACSRRSRAKWHSLRIGRSGEPRASGLGSCVRQISRP